MPKSPRQTSLPGMDLLDENEVKSSPTTEKGPNKTHDEAPNKAPDIRDWTLCAVDAHSLIYQVFHALPEMTSPSGEPVGAVYGFVRDMLQLIETHRPDALLCAFDLPGPTFRHDLYEGYKADRSAMPEELVPQIPKNPRSAGSTRHSRVGMFGLRGGRRLGHGREALR